MKILIAEDDPVGLVILKQFLSPYGEIETAVNGRQAVAAYHAAIAQNEPFDLVCLDIKMPEMDGHEVLAEIRELEDMENRTKVIMITSHSDRENVKKAAQQCDDYIVKPVNRETLIGKIGSLGLL